MTYLALLAATCAADTLHTSHHVHSGRHVHGDWRTNNGAVHSINADDGCRTPNVPGMVDFCIDYRRQRLHFRFGGQKRRCMRRRNYEFKKVNAGNYEFTEWNEAPCDW
ncbi:hypothetical protein CDD80_2801 [Ophiocordyceps camponoti-rufipedis]|uniref:Uncharacterized protein n=1 Tax=Ophiocordyceps camponoti-rufipedis TaxID=2004952 RepID=A0A2C5ZJS5_9HYPO|nr:hypothetical protein CDD80_2801 [Ophiocordyceps camponoti-rufipedis]